MKIDVIDKVKEMEDQFPSMEYLLCKGLMMPFNPSNSGSRKQMMAAQLEQGLELYHSELPRVQTGYENRFGDRSSSLIIADKEYVVVHKISKFSFDPDRFYYLIIYDTKGNSFDIITKQEYQYITESYGILYNTKYMDKLRPGAKISKGDTIRKSLAYDEFNNRCDGVNLMSTYLSSEETKEDGIWISETASKLLACPLVKKVQIQINDNDIPLNLYYDDVERDYKSFPDVGENTDRTNGVLMGIRRMKKEEILFTQNKNNLSKIMLSDDVFTASGTVVDVDIYCNNPETLSKYVHFGQLQFYHQEQMAFMNDFISKVGPLIESGYNCSYEMKKLYHRFKKIYYGGQYLKDNVFSNTILELTLVEYNPVEVGDKIANRYGGKGVVSKISPDNMMPLLDNGRRVDLIYNGSTCINRENNGQLNEMFLNYASNRIVDHVRSLDGSFDLNYTINLYIDYLNILNPNLAERMEQYILSAELDDQVAFMQYIFDEGFILSLDPMCDINIDTLYKIWKKFGFIKQYNVVVPQIGSDGNYRYVKTRRTLECGEQYIWRLKQYAEEKFSTVSLSATNLKNENTRNSSKKSYKSPHAKTCVRFGDMETGNMLHLGIEPLITNLMMLSLAPKARRRLGTELTEGPLFDLDVKLHPEDSNRSVEILNAYLITIGLKLTFTKVPKKFIYPIKYNINGVPVLNKDDTSYHPAITYIDKKGNQFIGDYEPVNPIDNLKEVIHWNRKEK